MVQGTARSEDGEVSKANPGPEHKERIKQAHEQVIATLTNAIPGNTGAQLTKAVGWREEISDNSAGEATCN